jgi:hypothetical protein
MAHELETEFASYREALETEEEKLAFDREIVLLLERRGVDYVRGYVDGLRDALKRTPSQKTSEGLKG